LFSQALEKSESCAFVLHPAQWKVTEIILILKPGKSNKLTPYLPTSLLKRLLSMVKNNGLIIPNHQFSFRQRHSTIEQTHHIVRINEGSS
jgi:hypothetical protein